MTTGTVVAINEKRFGFIDVGKSEDVFFHANDLDGLEFGDQLLHLRVAFELVETAKGPRASSVRAAN
jgi:cold shock CspA family protein